MFRSLSQINLLLCINQRKIKRVLLAEAQNRRLHSTFGWVSLTFTLVVRVKFTFILDLSFHLPFNHTEWGHSFFCAKGHTCKDVRMCTGKKKQKNQQQKEQTKICVT